MHIILYGIFMLSLVAPSINAVNKESIGDMVVGAGYSVLASSGLYAALQKPTFELTKFCLSFSLLTLLGTLFGAPAFSADEPPLAKRIIGGIMVTTAAFWLYYVVPPNG